MAFDQAKSHIFDQAQAHIEKQFNHQFENVDLLREAMSAGSHVIRIGGNQNLAFIGRKVLDLLLSTDAYVKGIIKSDSTHTTAATLSQANLSSVGRAQKLHQLYSLDRLYQEVSHRLMTAAVEATFGAVFVDSGMDLAVVRRGMEAFDLI